MIVVCFLTLKTLVEAWATAVEDTAPAQSALVTHPSTTRSSGSTLCSGELRLTILLRPQVCTEGVLQERHQPQGLSGAVENWIQKLHVLCSQHKAELNYTPTRICTTSPPKIYSPLALLGILPKSIPLGGFLLGGLIQFADCLEMWLGVGRHSTSVGSMGSALCHLNAAPVCLMNVRLPMHSASPTLFHFGKFKKCL